MGAAKSNKFRVLSSNFRLETVETVLCTVFLSNEYIGKFETVTHQPQYLSHTIWCEKFEYVIMKRESESNEKYTEEK